ncbi:MAG: PAS domain S-box protein [Candidatus Moranbacteria bacterium]|nr:PAS domain S-box protein [Candidatus Moranbacteria bacterium]
MLSALQSGKEDQKKMVSFKDLSNMFQTLTENTIDGIVIFLRKNGQIVYSNRLAQKTLHSTAQKLIKKKISDFVSPRDFQVMITRYQQRQKGVVIPYRYETKIKRVKGGQIPVQLSITSVTWKDLPALTLTIRNISKRKKMEKALKQSEQNFQIAFENLIESVFWIDLQGKILNCNQAATKLLQTSKKQIIGKNCRILLAKDSPNSCKKIIQSVKTNTKGISKELDLITFKKNNRNVILSASLMQLKNKKVIQAVLHDITDKKKILSENKKLAQFPLENPAPVFRVSRQGRVTLRNKSSADLVKSWTVKSSNRLKPVWAKFIKDVFQKNRKKTFDYTFAGKSYSLSINPVQEFDYVNVYAFDLTKQKKAEAREKQAILEALEARKEWEKTVNNIPQYIFLLNNKGKIIRFNKAVVKKLKKIDNSIKIKHQFFSHLIDAFFNHDLNTNNYSKQYWLKAWKKTQKSKGTIEEDIEDKQNDKFFIMRIHFIPDPDKKANGHSVKAVGIIHDITDRVKTRRRMLDLFKYLGVLNRRMSLLISIGSNNRKKKKQNIYNLIVKSAKSAARISYSLLYLWDEKNSNYFLAAYSGAISSYSSFKKIQKIKISSNSEFKKIILNNNRYQATVTDLKLKKIILSKRIKYVLILPLKSEKKELGFLFLAISRENPIDTQGLDFYEIFAIQSSNLLINLETSKT